jgi:small subunit ribosomal protein S17
MQGSRSKRKERLGIVISDKMDKTRVVRVERLMRHHLYGKIIRKAKRFKAHDEKNASKVGDKVRIMETRPLSKDKRWRIVEIIKSE